MVCSDRLMGMMMMVLLLNRITLKNCLYQIAPNLQRFHCNFSGLDDGICDEYG